jgi:hypothetical protein
LQLFPYLNDGLKQPAAVADRGNAEILQVLSFALAIIIRGSLSDRRSRACG